MRLGAIVPVLFLALVPALATPPGGLVVDVDDANPPFMYAKDGKPSGIYPQFIEAAFKHMNQPVVISAKPWKKDIEEADAGVAGIAGIYRNPDREKKYDYSDRIFMERISVFFSKAAPVAYARIEDLKGRKVGVIRGWSYGDDFDNARKANLLVAEEAESDEANFVKLESHQLDAVVAITESGTGLMTKYKNVGFSATPVSANPTFLIFAKSANEKALLKQFDQAIKDMQASGELKKLVAAALAK